MKKYLVRFYYSGILEAENEEQAEKQFRALFKDVDYDACELTVEEQSE